MKGLKKRKSIRKIRGGDSSSSSSNSELSDLSNSFKDLLDDDAVNDSSEYSESSSMNLLPYFVFNPIFVFNLPEYVSKIAPKSFIILKPTIALNYLCDFKE